MNLLAVVGSVLALICLPLMIVGFAANIAWSALGVGWACAEEIGDAMEARQ